MGTDIHFFVEKRVKDKWVSADKWEIDKDCEPPRERVKDELYGDRNYNLFAILANVRNGAGFAGIKTGEGFVPIAMPRGLPDDVCDRIQKECDEWGSDGHSHSYLTVAEIMDYDWTQETKLEGDISGFDYEEYDRQYKPYGEGPRAYAGMISGRDIKRISEEEMEHRCNEARLKFQELRKGKPLPDWDAVMHQELDGYVTHTVWGVSYYKCAKNFLAEALPKLWRIGKPEDVRIVFWFDN